MLSTLSVLNVLKTHHFQKYCIIPLFVIYITLFPNLPLFDQLFALLCFFASERSCILRMLVQVSTVNLLSSLSAAAKSVYAELISVFSAFVPFLYFFWLRLRPFARVESVRAILRPMHFCAPYPTYVRFLCEFSMLLHRKCVQACSFSAF